MKGRDLGGVSCEVAVGEWEKARAGGGVPALWRTRGSGFAWSQGSRRVLRERTWDVRLGPGLRCI